MHVTECRKSDNVAVSIFHFTVTSSHISKQTLLCSTKIKFKQLLKQQSKTFQYVFFLCHGFLGLEIKNVCRLKLLKMDYNIRGNMQYPVVPFMRQPSPPTQDGLSFFVQYKYGKNIMNVLVIQNFGLMLNL